MSRVVCLGLATLDTIFHVPHAPDAGGRVVATELVVAGGGPAATAAVTLSRLGVETAFVGVVADDEVGAAVRDGLAQEGVDVSELVAVAGARSPRSSILVDRRSAARTIVHYPGTVPPVEPSPRALELCRAAACLATGLEEDAEPLRVHGDAIELSYRPHQLLTVKVR